MVQPIQVNSAEEAQQNFQKLRSDANTNPAFKDWSDKLPLKPLLEGGAMLIVTDEKGPKNYQLWMHEGKLTAYSHENINALYEREVLNKVIIPINSGQNPITGGELLQVRKGEKGTGREAETIWGYDDPRAETLHGQARMITNAFHRPADMNPAVAIAMPQAVFDALPESLVHKEIAPLKADVKPPKPAVRPEAEVPLAPSSKRSQTPPAVLAWGPTEAGVSDAKMKAVMPPETIGTRSDFNAANIAASAALQQMKMTYQEGRPEGDRMSKAQIEQVISRHEKVNPAAGTILRQAYKDMDQLKEHARGPGQVFNKAHDDLAAAYNGVRGKYDFVPQSSAPSAWGPTEAGVSEDKMKLMLPPEKIGSPTDFIAARSAASATLQQIKMTYWEGVPENERMSKAQIEQVISVHEKAYPEFGKILRASYAEMESLKKDNILERVNGPIRIFNNGVAELSRSYNAHVHEFQQKPEIQRLPPAQSGMFNAKPGDLNISMVRASIFMGFLDKTPEMASKPDLEKIFKTYDDAYPKLGKIMRDTYREMEATTAPEDRHARFNEGMKKMLEFGRNPREFNNGPTIEANANETNRVIRVSDGLTGDSNNPPPQRSEKQMNIEAEEAFELMFKSKLGIIDPKEFNERIEKLREANPRFADIADTHRQDFWGGVRELAIAFAQERGKLRNEGPTEVLNIDEKSANRMYAAALGTEGQLPKEFKNAHDFKPEEPELVAAGAVPSVNNAGMKPV